MISPPPSLSLFKLSGRGEERSYKTNRKQKENKKKTKSGIGQITTAERERKKKEKNNQSMFFHTETRCQKRG